MSLTKKQIEILESMELNKWVRPEDLPGRVGVVSIGKLIKEGKCVSIKIERPIEITEEEVNQGYVKCKITEPEDDWHSFIKKIDGSFETSDDIVLEDRLSNIEKKLELLLNKINS